MYFLMQAANFIIHTVFDAYIIILLLRLLLQKLGASWHNPVSQFLYQLTEKPIKPFRKIMPGAYGFDFAIVLFALILQCIQTILLLSMQIGMMPNMLGVLIIAIGNLLSKCVYIYLYAIIINVIVSWLPELNRHPIAQLVYLIVDPVLSHVRRIIPLIAGIDISPIPILLCLTLINKLVVNEIIMVGMRIVLS